MKHSSDIEKPMLPEVFARLPSCHTCASERSKAALRVTATYCPQDFALKLKTCYRVDQLGSCNDCGTVVSSLETVCPLCGSRSINRKDDSKWLIALRNDREFEEVIAPKAYYFVLFEFSDITDASNNDIDASIWEVDPRSKGFAYCMIDYYLNIRARSTSKAPFNMWPYQFKFGLTKPILIYKSRIKGDGSIETLVFPTYKNSIAEELLPLINYSGATTITEEAVKRIIAKVTGSCPVLPNKRAYLGYLQEIRRKINITNSDLCDLFAEEIYLPLIIPQKDSIPSRIKDHFPELR